MAKAGTYRIPVVTRTQDNGDGGYTTYAYNTQDELIADHPKADAMTPELRQEILNGDDEYENGYMGSSSIIVNVAEDDTMTLAEPLHFHAGQ